MDFGPNLASHELLKNIESGDRSASIGCLGIYQNSETWPTVLSRGPEGNTLQPTG